MFRGFRWVIYNHHVVAQRTTAQEFHFSLALPRRRLDNLRSVF
jgi:hypothetical protein